MAASGDSLISLKLLLSEFPLLCTVDVEISNAPSGDSVISDLIEGLS